MDTENTFYESDTEQPKSKKLGKAAATVAAALAGAAAVTAAADTGMEERGQTATAAGSTAKDTAAAQTSPIEAHASARAAEGAIPTEIHTAGSVSDSMSFKQAFATARGEVGAGGVFEWHGKLYNTFSSEEWEGMAADARHAYAERVAPMAAETEAHAVYAHTATPPHHAAAVTPANVEDTSESDEGDVQVLGVAHDAAHDINVAGVLVDGHEVAIIDVDSDEVFDIMAMDSDKNGYISSDEVADISRHHITVDDLGGFTDGSDVPDITTSDDGTTMAM